MPEKQDNNESLIVAHIKIERAINDLRMQMGIIIRYDGHKAIAAYPIEFLNQILRETWFGAAKNQALLLTGGRARALCLTPDNKTCVQIAADSLSLEQLHCLADPLQKEPLPMLSVLPTNQPQKLALKLSKYASLLPALLAMDVDIHALPESCRQWQQVNASDIESYIAQPLLGVMEMSHAQLPIEAIENARLVSFRARYSTAVHLALVVGDISSAASPLTRVHSSCVTGDILGSLRCDCGDQLKMAILQIANEGCGILLYLHQEGRGIGINNKLRAYQLQEQGIDTYDANLMLGYEEDERDFSIAVAMLKKLGVSSIRLLTNNPQKLGALEKIGMIVSERVGLVAAAGKHNHAYLDTKAKKSGHLF